jgi:L-malate glycosyltransferase
MHIGICGPVATSDVEHLLHGPSVDRPRGYSGAPLLGTLICELIRKGHKVSVFTLSSDLPLKRDATVVLQGPSLELHCCPMRPKAWPFNGRLPGRIVDLYAFERRALESAIARARPDVVHAHWSYEFAWAALRSGLPHVITCHDSPFVIARFQRDFRHGGYRWLRAFMAWHVLRHAQLVTTVSPYMVDQIQPLCRPDVAVRVIPNPITDEAFVQKRLATVGGARVLMVANGWDVRKNGQAALRAFSLFSEERSDAELHVYGHDHGPDEAAATWWRESGLTGRVFFHGAAPHRQILAAMSEANVFLHAALEESFGAVIAEAMASGTPVVGGKVSGAVPWVVGEGGLLVDVTRPEEIALAMSTLTSNSTVSARLAQVGLERVKNYFNTEAVTTAYESELSKAVLLNLGLDQVLTS